MRPVNLTLIGALAILGACTSAPAGQPATQPVRPQPQAQPQQAAAAVDAEDPFLWLEDVEGERSLAWVRERNQRSLGTLQSDQRYQRFYDAALKIAEARDRIAFPSFRGRDIENFWQDSANIRGVWRKTTLESYRSGTR